MTTLVNNLDVNENGIQWFEVSGTDYGTNYEFDNCAIFGITEDDKILDCEGCPLTKGGYLDVAVRNALMK